MKVVLGIDLGTTYFKCGLIDSEGNLQGLGHIAVPTTTGNKSKSELEIGIFFYCVKSVIHAACSQAQITPNDIKAISYSSQANSFLLLDRHCTPLTPIVLWSDFRADGLYPAVQELWAHPRFLEITGLGLRGKGFCLEKILWLKDQYPAVWEETAHIMSISDFFTFTMIDETYGDCGTGSLIGLWDINRMTYWDDALRHLNLDRSLLSTLCTPGTYVGKTGMRAKEVFEIPEGIPFSVGSLDHHAAALGAGLDSIAPYSESMGTVLALLQSTNEFNPQQGCSIGPGAGRKKYYKLTFTNNGAISLEWYQKTHAPEMTLEELNQKAALVPAGSNGVYALPSVNIYDELSGFMNINSYNAQQSLQHGHYVRSIMESVAGSFKELMETLTGGDYPAAIVATGGGAKSDLWLQILSDMSGVKFLTSKNEEPACIGAGLFAATTTGWFRSIDEIPADFYSIQKVYNPIEKNYREYQKWWKNRPY